MKFSDFSSFPRKHALAKAGAGISNFRQKNSNTTSIKTRLSLY
ncbi:MAG: hypothetical protein OXJ52_01990 [Oligoflexia bacterium]|nr:hypothetical protein [Oligoflexia bacterium]